MVSDRIGGILLMIGALLYGVNVYDTWVAGGTQGVNVVWATFFTIINIWYTYIFYNTRLWWSAAGSGTLAVFEGTWLAQIIYYML